MFGSVLGSRRPEDYIFDSAVLLTLGSYFEKTYGTPFVLKMCLFGLYMSLMTSMFWVGSPYAAKDRYKLVDPNGQNCNFKNFNEMKFSGMHGVSMSFVYYYLFKNMKVAVVPVLAADMYFYGPYFMSGILNGLAWGIVV